MSDAAKSPEEIEDVLASIRSLVADQPETSGELSTTEELDKPEAQAAPPDVEPERLVLTPSFRVQEAGDPWVAVEDTDLEEATPWQPDDRLSEFDKVEGGSTDDIEQFDAATVEIAADAEAMIEDVIASDQALEALRALDGTIDAEADNSNEGVSTAFESETGDDNWPGDGAGSALLSLAALRDRDPDPASDALEEDANLTSAEAPNNDGASVTGDDGLDEAARIFSRRTEETNVAAEHENDSTDVSNFAEAHNVDESLATSKSPVDTEIDAAVKPPESSISNNSADAQVAEDLGAAPRPFTFPDSDEGLLDEDTLRDIIVVVVREELQGVLGQRITRNVRKMVRREIRLALAAEELE